ncbi:TetR/AcrR family transcriptional regulator [Helcobacillus massiliensis]|uniref:AcrR family transcriptional regulator n=1 Tax=Helcobacillus massiliensis TaxID=521392 RepID=A0A839QZE7_9MICO|nr:TetR/AcrR family transcriptional regulator [Helcobacillus massiliensis]MBB3022767.1 AcrR family transcriptional regulator [Helcobacillus massiliensis]MCT1558228.1 TetR/AcrR family transcriptional regulator [Helcobacillus massiliensis]MCT2036417.1 TetR/AcrR family transcriptional regulator [Helcobacillus massiliensis]MCT2332221.1 TetR/AcrR family transcriptional regulator [Helcobacillus massiliensis]
MTKRMPRAQRRAQLIDIATQKFGEKGFHPTSMENIASAAGITKPVLYQHFASKEDMYVAVIASIGEYLREQIASYSDFGGTTEDRVRAGVTMYFNLMATHRQTMQMFFGKEYISDDVHTEIRRIQDEGALAIAEVFTATRNVERRTALTLGRIFAGSIQSSAHQLADSGPDELHPDALQAAIDETVQLLTYGVMSFQGAPEFDDE